MNNLVAKYPLFCTAGEYPAFRDTYSISRSELIQIGVNELLGFLPPSFWPFNGKGKEAWTLPVGHVGNILYCAHFLVTNTVFGKAGSALQPAFCTIDYCKTVNSFASSV